MKFTNMAFTKLFGFCNRGISSHLSLQPDPLTHSVSVLLTRLDFGFFEDSLDS